MKTPEELKSFYEKELLPSLTELNAKRKKTVIYLLAFTFGMLFFALVCVVGAIILINFTNHPCMFCCFILAPLIWIGVFAAGYGKLKDSYVKEYKALVMPGVVKFIDPGLNYTYKNHIQQQTFSKSRIFLNSIDRYWGEDYVSGIVGKTTLEFSEVEAQEKHEYTDSKGHRHTSYQTFFRGIFFVADFNKNFKGITLVLPDFAQSKLGMIGEFFQKHNVSRPPLIKLEDVEFEKLFVVYGDDQVESRYILSPSLMKRLVDFKTKTNRHIYVSFLENNIMVAVPSGKNQFEPRLFRSIVDYKQIEQYYNDFKMIIDIVDELNLNTRIWSKQ